MDETVLSLVKPLAKVATKLNLRRVFEGEDIPLTGSHFGGQPYAEIGERWPVCPVCEVALTFICQMDVGSGFHEKPKGIDLFTFFYCWECGPWGLSDEPEGTWVVRTYADPSDRFTKPIRPSGPEPDPPYVCVPETEKVSSFPDADEIDRYREVEEVLAGFDEPSDAYEAAVEALGGVTDFCTLVGGYPSWIQGADIPVCNHCQNPMSLLTQIDTEGEPDIMWGDSGCVYLFYCPTHPREVQLTLQCF